MNTRGDNVDEEFEGQPEESLLSPEPEVIAPEIELLEDVTQLYLTEIGAKPLLTPEEELARIKKVKTPAIKVVPIIKRMLLINSDF